MYGITTGRLQGQVCWYRESGGYRGGKSTPWKLVYVTEHVYNVDGRLSNWVRFCYLTPKLKLSKRTSGDYDYGEKRNFKIAKGYKREMVVRKIS